VTNARETAVEHGQLPGLAPPAGDGFPPSREVAADYEHKVN